MTERFTERHAIQIAMQDLTEQTRRDHDLYFESKQMRNKHYNILMDRLRALELEEPTEQFTERDAIKLAMQDLKEQTRMDYDLYFESKKMRDSQHGILMDRLRIIDEREYELSKRDWELEKEKQLKELARIENEERMKNQIESSKEESEWVQDPEDSTIEPDDTGVAQSKSKADSLAEIKLNRKRANVRDNIRRAKVGVRKPKPDYIPFERVESVVLQYLSDKTKPEHSKDIQKHVEKELESAWKNFSGIMSSLMKKYPNLKRVDRGQYTYTKQESTEDNEKEKETISEAFGFKK